MRSVILVTFILGNSCGSVLHPVHTLAGPAPIQASLVVDAHDSVYSDAKQIEGFLQIGSDVLQRVDGQDDVSVNIKLTLEKGRLGRFSLGKGEVANCVDLVNLFKLPGDAHIVRTINCCDGVQYPVLGCSSSGGSMIIFSDPDGAWTAEAQGVLWAHEYGHKAGLHHRDRSDPTFPTAIMAPAIDEAHTMVNPCERDHYLGTSNQPCPKRIRDLAKRPAVATFVRQFFVEGLPYEEGASYTSGDIRTLVSMLNDCSQKLYWPNIVNVLGMIGDPMAFQPLKDFIEVDPTTKCGPTPQFSYLAKDAVPIALGYILSKHPSSETLTCSSQHSNLFTYLCQGLRQEAWSDRVSWNHPNGETRSNRNARLTRMSILGLALSGRVEAGEILQRLNRQPNKGRLRANGSKDDVGELLKEALQINEHVRRVGLVQYYRDSAADRLNTSP